MDHYAVIGNPVTHSKSPRIHNRFAELTGEALHYDRLQLPQDGFSAGLAEARRQGLKGANVTVPFKLEAFACAQHKSERAQLAGACNTLWFEADGIHADNTDGIGLVRDITVNAGVPVRGARVLLVGAGGAAAGALGPLLEQAPRELVVSNRSPEKARALVERHAALAQHHGVGLSSAGLMDVGGAFDLIVNATSASLAGAAAPLPASAVRPGTLVVDMMYGPAAAPFADWVRAHGGVPRDGLGMLLEQAAEAFRLWRGVLPPGAQVMAELRAEMA